jgi:hypothetical protein
MTPQPDDEPHNPWSQLARMRSERDALAARCGALRRQLEAVQWDKAGYCPICFPGEAPYRHTEDCALGRALEGRDE